MAFTVDVVRAALRQHILHNYLFSDDPGALGDDDSFQDTRQIDSMGMMQLIPFVEREFGITIGEADLVPERLDSVNRLVALVMDKTGQGAAAEPRSLVELLARSVDADPSHTALVTRTSRISYGQLWDQVCGAAARLADRGVQPGDRVALLAAHTAETVALYYAILAAGAVVVPLDPRAKPRELEARLVHTGARLFVVDADMSASDVAAAGIAGLAVSARDVLATPGPAAVPVAIDPQAVAALVYTSGTIAEPRAVMLSHANLVANTRAIVEYLGLTASDSVMSPLPIFYAYGASVLHTHLAAGGTVVLGDMRYAERTLEWMIEEQVTGFSGVAWMFAFLLDRTTLGADAAKLPALRYMTQAGSRLPAADAARMMAALPGVRVFAMYGQTEATSRLAYLPPDDLAGHPTSVGRAIPGVEIAVWRADGTPAGANETGEIVARGPNIMLGYWREPAGTDRVITNDARGRWLHTGDLGHFDRDGRLYVDGRLSEMIKVCGHRVNPAEIEEVVRLLGDVADAAAVGVPNGALDDAIHLHVVRSRSSALNEADVIAHCRTHLSLYKVPRRVVFTGALPRTASGKTQRHRLIASADVAS
jgi:acyl-CoA synthetase (AMP-forming)/AMP-acid ligase II/acyl carrier protein